MKVLKYGLLVITVLAIVVWLGVKDALTPVVRDNIGTPIYTLGDSSYQQALAQQKQVLKFGPLFWGQYPGGLAFTSAEQALQYLRQNPEEFPDSSEWGVYQLSGDLERDVNYNGATGQLHIRHSLLVIAGD
ncbi:hypothetical protein [Bacterioplanoides sp.]|uniref:hypothetical protein n=1 Tax=Bacterioplanoides sp. TaxID=2066072 RepID=UPI003B0020F2